MPFKRSVAVTLLSFALAGCATTGRVADHTFHDARHGISITFPDTYAVKPASGRGTRYRATALRRDIPNDGRSRGIVSSYGLYVAPKSALQRRANTNDELLKDFVMQESDNYCVRLHRIVARPIGDRTVKLTNGGSALIRDFNSSVQLPDHGVAYCGGAAAFVDLGSCLVKLEYIADSASVDRDEFISVLRSINIK